MSGRNAVASNKSGASRWQTIVTVLVVAGLVLALPVALWLDWQHASTPTAQRVDRVDVSAKTKAAKRKPARAAAVATPGAGTTFSATNAAGAEIARMAVLHVSKQAHDVDPNPDVNTDTIRVTLAVRNTGTDVLTLSPGQFQLTDDQGVVFPALTSAEEPVQASASPVAHVATPVSADQTKAGASEKGSRGGNGNGNGNGKQSGEAKTGGRGGKNNDATPASGKSRQAAKTGGGATKDHPAKPARPTVTPAPDLAPAAQAGAPADVTMLTRAILVNPGETSRLQIVFSMPPNARVGELLYSPSPDRPLQVADIGQRLRNARQTVDGSATGTPAASGREDS